MKKLFFITALVIMLFPMIGHAAVIDNVRGYILLQVEENGEAWYVNPADNSKYYMKDGGVAYQMMRNFGLGITDIDLNKIPSVSDTTEMKNLSSICSSNSLANRLKGKILLQVQQHGEAWYIYPKTCRKIYMKDGEAAYSIMRFLGLGITNQNLNLIKSGAQVDIPETVATTNTTYSPTTSCPSNQLFYEPYNRCISYDESCNIKYQNSYLGETNTDGSYICYCDIGYEWAYPINTSGNYCKKIENLDNDNDGIPNEYDLHPNGGDVIKNKILEYVDDDNQMIYNFQVDIPYDWYHYYVNYKTHNFTSNFTNITDFVTPEAPPIKQLVGKWGWLGSH
ncbi:MAG: hypothetical protein NTX82_07795 [Candidatus Parcubacteria bacterium]|nr:hypothetical protein [Candidatus Parcubacteria bacterium]